MKIIKYRAWSPKIAAFIYWQSDQKAALGMFWELCQSEGLEVEMGFSVKDLTIYEEDIATTKDGGVFVVVFEGGAFRLQDMPTELWYCVCDDYCIKEMLITICGTTHQNPELLPK